MRLISLSLLLLRGCEAYVAEDGPARRATIEKVRNLYWDAPTDATVSSERCTGTIVMMDNRLMPLANTTKENGFLKASDVPYYKKAFALNYLYAKRHGLNFRIIRPTSGAWLSAQGAKSARR